MKSKVTLFLILLFFSFGCQTNHRGKDDLDPIQENKDNLVEKNLTQDIADRGTTRTTNNILYLNNRHQITCKVSSLKSDENFNKYVNVEVTNRTKKKIVALAFLVNNDFYSGGLREKITVKSNSIKSFKLYIPENIPRPELVKIFLNEAIFYDGEIYNTLPKVKAY